MDQRLVAWARAVKSRHRGWGWPPLWLFTDPARQAGIDAVRSLPRGLCGVVFRHDDVPGRAGVARDVARLCRQRRLTMTMVGYKRLPGVAAHRRGGRGSGQGGTASAHGAADLVRARRAGCALAVLSPVFQTASHPGAERLGLLRWCALARRAGLPVLAMGGIDGRNVRRLPRWVVGIGAIGALVG